MNFSSSRDHCAPVQLEIVTDPDELANARALDEQFYRNAAWLKAHAAEVYSTHRGMCICISGEELFVARTPEAVLALAKAAHPNDQGSILRYIPQDKVPRIYANRR